MPWTDWRKCEHGNKLRYMRMSNTLDGTAAVRRVRACIHSRVLISAALHPGALHVVNNDQASSD